MSKQVDLTKPLSDNDRKYLQDRGMTYELEQNRLNMLEAGKDVAREGDGGPSEGSGTEEVDPTSEDARNAAEDDEAWAASLKVSELQKAIRDREAPEDEPVDFKGLKKDDLVVELLAILEEDSE